MLLQDESHAPLQQIRLLLEGLPCLARGLQRNEHALLHHVPARTAYGEPAHPDRGVRPAVAFPDVFRAVVSRPVAELDSAVIAVTSCARSAFRARSASTHPSVLFGTLVPSPASTLRAAASASTGSDLPSLHRTERLGRSTSCTSYPASTSRLVSAAPYELVPSHPDAQTVSGIADHGDQPLVAGRIGRERLRGQRPAVLIDQGERMRVGMGVHPRVDPGMLHRRPPSICLPFPRLPAQTGR